jgi:peptidoglycan/LPS O-acetylase OafA/YrhL
MKRAATELGAVRQFNVNSIDLLRLLVASQVMLAHGVLHLSGAKPTSWPLLEALPGASVVFAIAGFLISAACEHGPW